MNLKEQYAKAKESFTNKKNEIIENRMVENWKKKELKHIAKKEEWDARVKETKKETRRKVASQFKKKQKSAIKLSFGKQSGTFSEIPGKKQGKGGNAFSF